MTKLYYIMQKGNGKLTYDIMPHNFIFANTHLEACMRFTEWILSWLKEEHNDLGQEEYQSVLKKFLDKTYHETYWYDGVSYKFTSDINETNKCPECYDDIYGENAICPHCGYDLVKYMEG